MYAMSDEDENAISVASEILLSLAYAHLSNTARKRVEKDAAKALRLLAGDGLMKQQAALGISTLLYTLEYKLSLTQGLKAQALPEIAATRMRMGLDRDRPIMSTPSKS